MNTQEFTISTDLFLELLHKKYNNEICSVIQTENPVNHGSPKTQPYDQRGKENNMHACPAS